MTEEQTAAYKAMVERINKMTDEEVKKLVDADQCPFEPEHLLGEPLGMFHCEVCGEMVLAGSPHPRYKIEMPAPPKQTAQEPNFEITRLYLWKRLHPNAWTALREK